MPTDEIGKIYSQTNPDQIEIYSTDKVPKSYTVIGQVIASADAGNNAATTMVHLKKKAAKLGADAIIQLKLEVGVGYFSNAIQATGTAIKYTN